MDGGEETIGRRPLFDFWGFSHWMSSLFFVPRGENECRPAGGGDLGRVTFDFYQFEREIWGGKINISNEMFCKAIQIEMSQVGGPLYPADPQVI